MFGLRYLRRVTTLALDESKCSGCGMCVTVCPHEVLALESRKARIADGDACMECGACARNCEREAITVRAGVGCLEALVRSTFPVHNRRATVPANPPAAVDGLDLRRIERK